MGHLARVILALALVACGEPQPVVPEPGPGPDDDELGYCPAACDRWVELGCADPTVCTRYAEPSDECVESIPCSEWCAQVVVDAPEGVVFRPMCVATVELDVDAGDVCSLLDQTCGE